MADPPVSSLLMYTPDEIDFGSLSTDTVRALALEIDPFIATYALAELSSRGRDVERETARQLLRSTDDPWLRASSFDIVLGDDPQAAVAWLREHVDTLDDDTLGRLLEPLADDPRWRSAPGADELLAALRRRADAPGGELPEASVARVLEG
jgi:hypothetical protein